MGNDNSKSTIENQQLIMQLQQQLINQQNQQNQQNQHNQHNQQRPNNHQNQQNQYNQQNQQNQQRNNNQYTPPNINNDIYNRQLPVISPAELSNNIRNNRPPQQSQNYQQTISTPIENSKNGKTNLLAILSNKELMAEIDKKPQQKRKLLEKILNEHRHMMTSNQVSRINQQLSTLPPLDNYSNNSSHNKQNYSNPNITNSNITNTSKHTIGFNEGTTLQDTHSRQLQKTEQLNTIDALTKHYKTEAEEEEARFKLEEERRKQEFAEKQKQRRQHYQASLSDLEKANIDSLKLFSLDKNYTIDDLKSAYKKLAMKTHPDKAGGNVEKFQLVTKCYMSLLEKYKNRESDKNFNDLRVGSKNYIEEQQGYNNVNKEFVKNNYNNNHNTNTQKVEKDRFDSKLFNKIYEDNKLWESGDDGYGDWFTSEETDQPTEVFGNKFNLNVFNNTFEDYKDKATKENGAIQEYKEPQELVSCSTGFTDIDIYARKINDFSKALPTGKSKNDLAYTDLKTAYTSKGAFIDPAKVKYKTYNSIDDLKKDRSNVKYDMTPEQMRDYEMKKRRELEEEEKRQELIRQRDTVVSNTYSKNHERMLGYRGNASY